MKRFLLLSVIISYAYHAYATDRLSLTGSSTVAPLAMELSKVFENKIGQDNVRIDVQTGGSSRGIADALTNRSDIGMVSRAIRPEDRVKSFPIAIDGIAIILNASNGVTGLTKVQLTQIYRGEISNWRRLGGEDRDITVVHKAAGRSTQEVFLKYLQVRNSVIKPHIIVGDNQQGIKTIQGIAGAIGYVSIGAALSSPLLNKKIKMISIEGFLPSYDSVRQGTYPITRTLNFVTKDEPRGLAAKFLEFALSRDAHEIINQQSFVPIIR